MLRAGFEPAIPATKRPKTYALILHFIRMILFYADHISLDRNGLDEEVNVYLIEDSVDCRDVGESQDFLVEFQVISSV
jgi:hypothetical protein